jgi:rhizosphere induced protein
MYTLVDRTSALNAGQQYTLIFNNQSPNNWTFVCFQNQPSGLPMNYVSLAWFAQPAAPRTRIIFRWQVDYSFVWSQTGTLAPGVIFTASQDIPTNGVTSNNAITFTREPNGAFNFKDQATGPSGALTIQQDDTIPFNTASIGIGVSGAGTFAVQAQPNIPVTFVPTPTYYVAFGQSIQEGLVLNISQFTQVAQIQFPVNIYEVTATLLPNNKWSLSDGTSLTEQLNSLHTRLASMTA